MTTLLFDYAGPSALDVEGNRASLGLSADLRRPVRFHARVRQGVLYLRLALQTLGQVVWSDDTWLSDEEYAERLRSILDPVITVHPDRVFFEAFSQDQSVYGLVVAEADLFEPDGEVQCGTTNVDFTALLWQALGDMRSRRETWFRVGPEGFAVRTEGIGGRFERKVDVPDSWVRGLLQLQAAMALPGTRLAVRPVDLLAAIRFLRANRAPGPPRAARYEFDPGPDARLVLEPWEHAITLKGAAHNYSEKRVVRTWGRRRLRLLEPVLPYADGVSVYLKGRALPSFYAVRLPGVTLLLGLSGWTGNLWTGTGSFDLLIDPEAAGDGLTADVLEALHLRFAAGRAELARAVRTTPAAVESALARLCRQGRVIYDVEQREYRHRELFAQPIDEARYFPPDPRRAEARALLQRGEVAIASATPRETRKQQALRTPEGEVAREVVLRDLVVRGSAGEQPAVEVVVNDSGRMIFGRCGCDFFRANLLNRGPCPHLLALFLASAPLRQDLPSSHALPAGTAAPARRRARRESEDFDDSDFDEPDEDE
jgi:hypothetical protein